MNNGKMNTSLLSFIILSLIGLIFLVLIYQFSPRGVNPFKIIFLFIFILICLMGILAAIYPSYCLRFFKIKTVKEYECKDKHLKNEGHHPDCGEFHDHTFEFENRRYCVGCTGLLLGGFLAILTCFFYLIYGAMTFLFYLGVVMVFVSLVQMIFLNIHNRLVKFLSNLGLVWGSSLVLVGVLDYSNIFLSIYILFLILAWIFTRTAISHYNHDLICRDCKILD